jgi:hypothetical protein
MYQATSEDPKNAGEVKSAKKPYVKPAFRYERTFETTALSCGKTGVSERQCQFNKKTS